MDVARTARLPGASCPEYMVPSAFVVLEALPLTPNGKVDRKALPAPERRAAGAGEALRRPAHAHRGAAGGRLGRRCCGLEQVGIHDDFFELGGHSLLATQVVSRIRGAFHVELPLRELFESPRSLACAARVEALRAGRAGAAGPAAPGGPARPGALPLSFAQQRLWFLDQLEPGSAALQHARRRVRLEGALDVAALERRFARAGRAATRRCARRSARGRRQPVQVISPDAGAARWRWWTCVRVAEADREAAARRLRGAEAQRPVRPGRGPAAAGAAAAAGRSRSTCCC